MKERLRIFLPFVLTMAVALFAICAGKAEDADALRGQAQEAGESVRFIAFGDMGTGDKDQYALARRMMEWHEKSHYEMVLTLGDNIYPDGNPALLPAKFEKPYAELLQNGVRFYAALGNHDIKKGRTAQMNYPNFNMGGRAYYSFVKGGGLAEFFAIDSNDVNAEQLRWLEDALANSKAQWKIAYFHHPIYSSGLTHGSDTGLREKLEPLFVRYGVAVVLSGHDHVYERTKPQKGIQYFVEGAGSGKLRRGDLNRGSPFFAAGNDDSGSFLYIELSHDRLSFKAIDQAGRAFDQGEIPALGAISTPLIVPTLTRDAPTAAGEKSQKRKRQ